MKKEEQIAKLAEKTGLTKTDAGAFIDAYAELIVEEAVAGNQPKLGNLGYFDVSYRAARKGRNPQKPDESIEIPETAAPVFRSGKAFKTAASDPAVIARVKAK